MERNLEALLSGDALEHLSEIDREALFQLLARLDAAEKVCRMIDESLSPARRAEELRARNAEKEHSARASASRRVSVPIHWWDVRAAINVWKDLVRSSTMSSTMRTEASVKSKLNPTKLPDL
jgi:hypothetical protein